MSSNQVSTIVGSVFSDFDRPVLGEGSLCACECLNGSVCTRSDPSSTKTLQFAGSSLTCCSNPLGPPYGSVHASFGSSQTEKYNSFTVLRKKTEPR